MIAQIILEDRTEYAEVLFFFCADIGEECHGLAVVSVYSLPDKDLLAASTGTYYSVRILPGEEGLRVISVKAIESVVSIQPRYYHLEPEETRWFIWEKMGLQVNALNGIPEEDDDDEDEE